MRILLLLIAIIINTSDAFGQLDLKKKLSIDVDNSRLEDVLSWLQSNHNLKLSYGFDNVSRDVRITLHSKSISVFEIIQQICHQGDLIFQVIDSTIVFKHQKSLSQLQEGKITERKVHQDSTLISEHKSGMDSLTTINKGHYNQYPSPKDSTVLIAADTNISALMPALQENQTMENKPVEVASISRSSSRLRRKVDIQTGLFVSYASDFNKFGYADRDISSQKYKTDNNESYCLGAYVLLSKKLYISLGATYVTKDFHLNYNYKVLDLSDPFPIPDKTYVELRYMEVPLTFGYALTKWKKYSALVSTGIYPSFLLREQENTTYQNQGNPNTKYFLKSNQSTLFSASVGFIVHRYLNRSVGVFIEPGYLHFFGPVNKQAMNSHTSLFRVKVGVQFALSGKR